MSRRCSKPSLFPKRLAVADRAGRGPHPPGWTTPKASLVAPLGVDGAAPTIAGSDALMRLTRSFTILRTRGSGAIRVSPHDFLKRPFQNLRASCEMDWNEKVSPHVAAAWIGHSVEISAKHYVRVRGEHLERITGTALGGANSGAQAVQNQTLQVAATERTVLQPTPQPLTTDRHVLWGAHPYRDMRSIKVGDGGLEPSTSRV